MKAVGILQSSYLTWKGYFDIIRDCDVFIFLDDAQYTRQDWRNRNKIKTPRGTEWLTIPVGTSIQRKICEVEIADSSWQQNHWDRIKINYGHAPSFNDYCSFFEDVYVHKKWTSLSELNQYLTKFIAGEYFGLDPIFAESRHIPGNCGRNERLIELIKAFDGTRYVSGPSAKTYIDADLFRQNGIELVWKDYQGYPEYVQAHPPFCHEVSIIDLLFNMGKNSRDFIWGWRERK